jgi:peptidoglycan/xylan/chitin deacetylase (PgdA/CDA1 family)
VASRLREAIAFALRFSGIPLLVRHAVARRKATILLYHDPRPELLETHLGYLSRRYHFITLDRLVEAIGARDWSTIPPRSLVLTLDDGHRGNALLRPVFERWGVRPTLYLVSRVVGTSRHFWFRHVGDACYALMPHPNARRLELLRERFGFEPTREYAREERQALSAEEIAGMRASVDFGSHTCFHPILTTCSDAECERETRDSKRDLEELLGRECRHFSYPNGDYSERELRMAREAGYLSARTVDVGWNDVDTDPFRLRMLGVSDDASLNVLAVQLCGLTTYLRHLRGGSLSGRHRTIQPSSVTA